MIDFDKNPLLGIFIYGLLLVSCIIQILEEFGFHEFDSFASHHGMAIFALGGVISNWDNLSARRRKNSEG